MAARADKPNDLLASEFRPAGQSHAEMLNDSDTDPVVIEVREVSMRYGIRLVTELRATLGVFYYTEDYVRLGGEGHAGGWRRRTDLPVSIHYLLAAPAG